MKEHNSQKHLIVNRLDYETRIALIENEHLSELFIERNDLTSIVGSIYKGKVNRVLPGMQSAFVDIGLDRSAYLFSSDILSQSTKNDKAHPNTKDGNPIRTRNQPIQKLLKPGQEVLVQVTKNAIGTKGSRVSSFINLPGKYLIMTPFESQVGVSKKIENESERNRLKNLITQLKGESKYGFLIRTSANGADESSLQEDITFLESLWESIKEKSNLSPCPSLLHKDYSVLYRVIRDNALGDLNRIIVDNENTYKEIYNFLDKFEPNLLYKLELYSNETGIFDAFGIERELNTALEKKVWLKSGGFIVIEQTEALTAIDVNTGKFIGSNSLNDTILKTNLEAAQEIVLQLRLRNIGGIIIIDFIDMHKHEDRDLVFDSLTEELKKDKTRTSVLKISDLGLVQMTRQRTDFNLKEKLCSECPTCEGKGFIKSPMTVCHEILRELDRLFKKNSYQYFTLEAHHTIIDRLLEEDAMFFNGICEKYQKQVDLKSNDMISFDLFQIQKNFKS